MQRRFSEEFKRAAVAESKAVNRNCRLPATWESAAKH